MQCYIFLEQTDAQTASSSIWDSVNKTCVDKNAYTDKPVIQKITKGWASPQQRVTDNMWCIPVCDQVANTASWQTDTWDSSWFAQGGD